MFKTTLAAGALSLALGATPAMAQYYDPYYAGCYDDWGNSIPCYNYGFYGGPFFGFGGPFFFGHRHFHHSFPPGFFVNHRFGTHGFAHRGFFGDTLSRHRFVGHPCLARTTLSG